MTNLFDSIMEMSAPFNMIVLVVLIGSVAGIIGTIAKEIRKYSCHREEMELKREMLSRGMDGDEIAQVMGATAAHREKRAE